MYLKTILSLVAIFVSIHLVFGATPENDTLILVHVLHRHGDRTPNNVGYKNNPISNESFFWPHGYGQVSTEGKKTAYKIGTTLRKRYDDFLGNVFTMNYIDARTTDSNRTKMSLELMLAALWPPTMEEKFYPCLKWQPIPYNYIRSDKELDGTKTCKIYNSLYQSVFNSTEIQNALTEFNPVFEYVSNATGQEFSTPEDIFLLYMKLFAQKNYGYALENWTDPVFPDVLERIAVTQYYIESNTTDLRKLGAGYLLKKIINDSKAKIDGLLKPQSRKMFVYSAHERNLAYMLIALGVFNDKVPSYGCHILFEVHLIDNVYGFKIYYQDWEYKDPKLMTIPGCTEFCPYDKFVEIFKDIIPDDNFC